MTCVTHLTTPTSTCRQLSSRSPRPARLCHTYPFASLAFRGIAPFGRTPSCRLVTLSSRSKTSLFACTTISERKSRPTSTMPWTRAGRRRFFRHSSGALDTTRFSEGKGSDVLTFCVATLSPRALYVHSRRTMSGTSLSVESPHRYHHHHHHHHYQPPQTEKEEVYYLLFANKPWSGDAQRSTVILSTSFTSTLHHNPPTHQKLTSYIYFPSVHYPLHHIFRVPFLLRSRTLLLVFSIRNTIRLSMLSCPSFGPTLLTRFGLAILKHALRIVRRVICTYGVRAIRYP